MKQMPLPSSMRLAPTLATRVFQLREFRNMTAKDLAKSARFNVERIEDIEGGIETWLSAPDRQLLARALAVEPSLLQEVETRIVAGHQQSDSEHIGVATNAQIAESILNGARELGCPSCGSTLKCSIQEGVDMDGLPSRSAKAFCIKCPFILRM
jgi:transcriptional regulator with XRE-family HTH domain